jgi:hypothetical protein
MRLFTAYTPLPQKKSFQRLGHEPKGLNHDHDAPANQETRWTQIGAGLALGATVVALGHQEEVLKMARNLMPQGNKIPTWLVRRQESSALLTMNPMTWLKAVGLMGSASLINKGLMLHLAPPLFALEIGAIFHSMIPGSIGMKTANFITMAPLLAGSAWLASSAHQQVNAPIDDQQHWTSNQKTIAKGVSNLAISGLTAVGAMAIFPHAHLGLLELRNPFMRQAVGPRPLLGGEKGWYIHTVHAVDGLVNSVRESLKHVWQKRNLRELPKVVQRAFQAPLWEQGHQNLNDADNYYRTHVPSMVRSHGVEEYVYKMLRAVPFTATSKAYRQTQFKNPFGAVAPGGKGLAKAFQPYYESELAHMTSQNLAEKIQHLETELQKTVHASVQKQHQRLDAKLKQAGVPELIRPAVVAKQMLEKLDKKNPLRPAYVDVAFHGDEAVGRAIEAKFQAGDPYEELRKAYNELAEEYNEFGESVSGSEQQRAVLQAKSDLLKHLEENSSDRAWHFTTMAKIRKELQEEKSEVAIYYRLLMKLDEKINAEKTINLNNTIGCAIGKDTHVEDTTLQTLYKNMIIQLSSSRDFEGIKEKYDTHTDHTNCSHTYNDIDFSGKPTAGAFHACGDPTHHHPAPTSNEPAPVFEGNGGDFFHLERARQQMLEALKHNPALVNDFKGQPRIGGLATLQALATKLQSQRPVLAVDSTLKQNFEQVNQALAFTNGLHDQGHLAPDTAQNIEEVLIKNQWDAKEAKAFTDALAMYTSKANHLKGHNPQELKAWAITAGAGGAVCANGCCAGSIFCFNEAVALVGSLYSSITRSLHLGHRQDDEQQKKTPSVQASH